MSNSSRSEQSAGPSLHVVETRGRFQAALPALASALAAAVTFAVTLGATFIYDDVPVILDDPRMHSPSLWYSFFTYGYRIGGVDHLYRPLTSLSFALQLWFHGDRAWAFHLVNVIAHAAASAAVAEFARRMFGARVALVAGILFAVHPVHTEAVAWIVGRAELFCTTAMFIGLCLLVRRAMTPGRICAILVCFWVAVLSKEQGVLFPILAILYMGMRWKDLRPPAGDPKIGERWKILGAALLFSLAVYFLVREATVSIAWDRGRLDMATQPMIDSAGMQRWLMPIYLFGRYLALLIAPVKLSIDYGMNVITPTVNWREPFIYLGAAGLAAWIVLTWIALRRRAWNQLFCLLAFALSYGLVGNVVSLIGTIFGERLMYLPSAFALTSLGALLARPRWSRTLMAVAVVILAVLGILRSTAYARLWNDRLTFYQASLAVQPRSIRLHELLFSELMADDRYGEAHEVAQDCVRQAPQAFEGYIILGRAAAQQGEVDAAWRALQSAKERGAGDYAIGLAGFIEQREQEMRDLHIQPAPQER